MMSTSDYNFLISGKWNVQPRINKISGPDKTVQIEPRVMEVLTCLCKNRNRVVSKDELVREVWDDQIITDNTITQAVSKLRKILEDDPAQPEYIETIPKKGYRFIAEVTPEKFDQNSQQPLLTDSENRFTKSIPLGIGALILVIVLVTVIGVSLSGNSSTDATLAGIPITSRHGTESDPAFSSDGHKLAYAWMNPDTGQQKIFVKIIDDPSSDLRLTDSKGQDSSPAWSPDGNRIVFMRHTGDECEIYTISSIGGRAEKLTSCGNNEYADLTWSPDGRWLAFNDETGNGSFGIVLVDAENGEKKFLTKPSSTSWGDYDPAFSPDGSRIAFVRAFSEGMQDLFVLDMENGDPQRITHENRNVYGLAWSKNTERIIFSSNRSGTYDLWSVSLPARKIHPVFRDDRHIINPDINAENRIIYESRFYDMNIWKYRFSNGQDKTVNSSSFSQSTRWELYPAISPDEQQIAFITDRSGSYELWVSNADGTNSGQLTRFNGPFVSNPDWSPDNSQIVFDARPDGHGDIYRINASGDNLTPVVTDPANDLVPRWSRDGNWIYFASDRSGRWQVWKTSPDGTQTQQVTSNGGFAARESIDGNMLYFTKPNEFGVWMRSVVEGNESVFVEHLDPGDWGNWQITERGIYLVNRRETDNPVISLKEFTTGEIITILEPGHSIPTHDAALAANTRGNRIMLGRQERRESDLMSVQLPN